MYCNVLTIYILDVTIYIVIYGGIDLDIFTVSFFGHRMLENALEVEKHLEVLLHDLIIQHEYVEFLIGRDGEFDLLAASAIRRAVSQYGCGNTTLTLVLPYLRAEYRDNEQNYLQYYDEVEICTESAAAHYKSAIQIRNRCMVDRSDLVIFCVQRQSGGAYGTLQYARKTGKQYLSIADSI